jgi:hypothetical protein
MPYLVRGYRRSELRQGPSVPYDPSDGHPGTGTPNEGVLIACQLWPALARESHGPGEYRGKFAPLA